MIAQITKGEKGIAEYLQTGRTYYSKYGRDEKDERIPLMGSLQAIEDSQNAQLSNPKNRQKYNYYHASLSFTREEWDKLQSEGKINEVLDEYIKLNFPNHSKDEMILYAEAHVPIVQSEPYLLRNDSSKNAADLNKKYEGKEIGRSPHIHLIVSFENMKFTRGIKSAGMIYSKDRSQMAASAIKFKSIVQDIMSLKFGLDNPEPLGLSRSELNRQYESFRKAAMVEKGKLKIQEEIDPKQILETSPIQAKTKDIELSEIKDNTKNSVIANEILRSVDPEIRAQNIQLAETLKSKNVNLFIPTLQSRYGTNIRSNEDGTRIQFETITPKTGKPSIRNMNIIDYVTKQLNIRFDDAVKILSDIALEQESLTKNLNNTDNIELSVSNDFRINQKATQEAIKKGSIHKKVYYAETGWKTITTNPQNIENILKRYSAVSMAKFSDGKRSNANISGFTKTLIFDIDNKEAHQDMKIKDAIELLKRKGIQGFIYPSSSHLFDGKTEKFRMIIPTTKAIGLQDVDTYKDYMNLAVRSLGLEGKIDNVFNTPAQCYYQPLKKDSVYIVDGKTFDNINIVLNSQRLKALRIAQNIENQAFENIDRIKQGIENQKRLELQHEPEDNEQFLTRVSLQALYDNVPLYDIVRYFEPSATLKEEGKNTIMHTRDGRHLYLKDQNTAFLFNQAKYVTPYTYLQDRMNEAYLEIKHSGIGENIEKLGILSNELQGFNPRNPNEISKFFARKMSKYWVFITKFNVKGFVKTLNECMVSWNDQKGIENVKKHYGLEKFKDQGASIEIGYIGRIWKSDLEKNGLNFKIEEPSKNEVEVSNKNIATKISGLDF